MAPNVKIMPVNVFEGEGATSYDVAYGIVYATDQGANVINLSLGAYAATNYEAAAVQYAASKGAVLVAAAGNDDTYFPVYPAAFDPVIAVSATDSSDWITDFSNYGDYIDLAAPGVNIYSTFPGSSYYSLPGTSMVAPIVSGTVALVLSKNPLLTRGEVENILRKSTVDRGSKGWDVFYGYGRIDAYKAVRNTPSPLSSVDDKKRKAAARSLSVVIDTKVAFSGVSLGQTLFKMDGVAKASFRMNLKEPLVVSAYVKTEKGAISKQLLRNKKYKSGSYTVSWDGKDNKNAFVSEGNYYYTVELRYSSMTRTAMRTLMRRPIR